MKTFLTWIQRCVFAGVCDDTGAIKYGGQREGVKNLHMSEETKKSNIQAIAMWGLRNLLRHELEKVDTLWLNMRK